MDLLMGGRAMAGRGTVSMHTLERRTTWGAFNQTHKKELLRDCDGVESGEVNRVHRYNRKKQRVTSDHFEHGMTARLLPNFSVGLLWNGLHYRNAGNTPPASTSSSKRINRHVCLAAHVCIATQFQPDEGLLFLFIGASCTSQLPAVFITCVDHPLCKHSTLATLTTLICTK